MAHMFDFALLCGYNYYVNGTAYFRKGKYVYNMQPHSVCSLVPQQHTDRGNFVPCLR